MENSREKALRVMEEVKKAVIGKDECIVKIMTAILAGGHILLEDIPGVGKTTMALAFSRALSLKQNRMQFTPDILPADILGFSVWQKEKGGLVYQPGAVMCNLFLADEINRTSPKTQSALLEVMEENSVTIDGVTRPLPEPFIVIATQNPFGSAGTQMLPESQVDRFLICMSLGYPDIRQEIEIAKGRSSGEPLKQVEPVLSAAELLELRREAAQIYVHDEIYEYIGKIVQKTREHELIELGISPRGTIAVVRMAKALAFLRNQTQVFPDDVTDILPEVMLHRLCMSAKSRVNRVSEAEVLQMIVEETKKPGIRRR